MIQMKHSELVLAGSCDLLDSLMAFTTTSVVRGGRNHYPECGRTGVDVQKYDELLL